MDDELKQEIIRILDETRERIRANMQAQKINASGRTSASIRIQTDEKTYWALMGGTNGEHKLRENPEIYGSDTAPIPTLEVGRKGGRVPVGFYYILKEWSRDKGLTFANEQERSTFAYFLARKIAREGTKRAQVPASVYSEPARTAADELRVVVSEMAKRTIIGSLGTIKTLKGAF